MSTGDRQNVRNLIEPLGFVAVVLGLIFVGIELRQNTSAVQASSIQSLNGLSQEHLLLMATDAELLRIWRESPENLSDAENLQLFYVIRAQWVRSQNAFFLWKDGSLGDEVWTTYEAFLCAVPDDAGQVGGAGHRHRTWEEQRPHLASSFVAFLEACWAEQN